MSVSCRGRLVLGVMLACCGWLAAAQEKTLPTVNVSGTALLPGLAIEADRLPYNVQSASAGALSATQNGSIVESMQNVLTGVNINEVQGGGFQSDLSFRGFRASPVLGAAQGISVYLDGVRINEPFGDVVNWDMVPEAALSSVSLVPGSNPMFGLNTLGGALAFATRSGRSDPGFNARLSLGSYGRKRADLAYGARTADGWHGFVAGTWFEENGWREHADGRLGNLFVKVGRHRGSTQWNLSLLHGESRMSGNGLLPSYRWSEGALRDGLYEDNPAAAYSYPDRTGNRLQHLAFSLRHQRDENTELVLTSYLRSSRRQQLNADINESYASYAEACSEGFDAGGAPLDPAACIYTRAAGSALHPASLNRSSTRQDAGGAPLYMTRYQGRHQWTVGADLDASRVAYAQTAQDVWFAADRSATADPGAAELPVSSVSGHATALAAYVSDTWEIRPATNLTATARFNHVMVSSRLTGGNGEMPNETFRYSALNPALGITQVVAGGLSMYGNVAQSNRVPTVIELGCADPAQPCRLPVGLQSDPYLKQVVSRTVEAGARWHARDVSAVLSLYRTVTSDDILFLAAGTTQQGYFANFQRTRRQGVELGLRGRHGSFSPYLSYSFLDATYDADGTLFMGTRNVQVKPGTPIAGLPRHTLKLGLDWKAGSRITVGGNLLAVSAMATQGNEDGLRNDDSGTPVAADWRVRGYALFSLYGSYRHDRRWEAFARVNNLFNRRHETYGVVAQDMFPNGHLVQPQSGAGGPDEARFVAPGAPRTVVLGLRYTM